MSDNVCPLCCGGKKIIAPRKCSNCDNDGKTNTENGEKVTCNQCDGTGYIEAYCPCPYCSGKADVII